MAHLGSNVQRLKASLPLLSLLLFVLLSAILAIRSDGDWLDDDLCHYMIARSAWRIPAMLINSWGRPGCTIPYALVANIGSTADGFLAARLLTVAMSLLTIWLTWLTARKMRASFAFLVPLIMIAMPQFFAETYTPCTEIPAALYTIAGVYLLSLGHRRWAAICFAILPATRHEVAPFLVVLGLYFLFRRDIIAALSLGWFEAAWAAICWKLGMQQPILRYFTAKDSSPYGSGDFLHYIRCWLQMAGAIGVFFCLAGIFIITQHRLRKSTWKLWLGGTVGGTFNSTVARISRLQVLAAGGALGLVALETLLFAFNRFASGGYATFLVPAAPLMALCACYGVAACARTLHRTTLILCAVIAAFQLWPYMHSYRLTGHQMLVASTMAQLRHEDPDCRIVGDSAWIAYYEENSPGARDHNALDTWTAGRTPHLYFLYNLHRDEDTVEQRITSVPYEIVRTVKIKNSDAQPDLIVYRRTD